MLISSFQCAKTLSISSPSLLKSGINKIAALRRMRGGIRIGARIGVPNAPLISLIHKNPRPKTPDAFRTTCK